MIIRSQWGWRLLSAVLLGAALWGMPAREAAAAPACTATMSALAFGEVDLVNVGGTPTATATLTYTCTNDQSSARYVRLCFNIGDGSASIDSGGGHWNPRILRDTSGSELDIQLYQDGTQTIWGSTTQVINDAYDIDLTLPRRISGGNPSVTSRSYSMRGVILGGQADTPPGDYSSNFNGNHTALRYGVSAIAAPADCSGANTDGGTFGFMVTAKAIKSCVVSADPLDFGTVDGLPSSANIDAQTTIRVTCSKPTAYTVALLPSNNSATGVGSMAAQNTAPVTGNTDSVAYRLYRNAGHSQPWGSQVGTNTASGTGTGASQSLTVYGRVPGLPAVQPDNYKDTVTVNVAY